MTEERLREIEELVNDYNLGNQHYTTNDWPKAVNDLIQALRAERARVKELEDGLRQIAYEPQGPADASDRFVLDAVTEIARNLLSREDSDG